MHVPFGRSSSFWFLFLAWLPFAAKAQLTTLPVLFCRHPAPTFRPALCLVYDRSLVIQVFVSFPISSRTRRRSWLEPPRGIRQGHRIYKPPLNVTLDLLLESCWTHCQTYDGVMGIVTAGSPKWWLNIYAPLEAMRYHSRSRSKKVILKLVSVTSTELIMYRRLPPTTSPICPTFQQTHFNFDLWHWSDLALHPSHTFILVSQERYQTLPRFLSLSSSIH